MELSQLGRRGNGPSHTSGQADLSLVTFVFELLEHATRSRYVPASNGLQAVAGRCDEHMTEVEDTQNQWVSCLHQDSSGRQSCRVPEGVSARLQELLNGQMSEQTLTPTTLRELATRLIEDMGCQAG